MMGVVCDRVLLMAGLQLCNLLGRGRRHSVTSQCRGGSDFNVRGDIPYDYMLLIVSLFLDLAGLRGVSRAHVYNIGESSKLRWSSTGGRGREEGAETRVKGK